MYHNSSVVNESWKCTCNFSLVAGHGRLMDPPGRSSLKYFQNDPNVAPYWSSVRPNYNDNQLFCGGFSTQVANGYRCGICGDNYADTRPRPNELGGTFGKSQIIPRQYRAGDYMPIGIQITAHHKGYFKFKLCKIENEMDTEPEDCFNR